MLKNSFIFLLLFSNYVIAQEGVAWPVYQINPVDRNPFKDDGVYISLQVGVNIDHIRPAGYNVDYLKFNRPVNSYYSVLVDFEDDEANGGIMFRIELGYKKIHFLAHGYPNSDVYSEYELKGHSWIPVLSTLYRVPWRWKIRPYGGIGIGFVISEFYKNTITHNYHNWSYSNENPFDYDDCQNGLQYTIGLMFGKRFDLACRLLWSKFHRDADHQRFRNRPFLLSWGYRF